MEKRLSMRVKSSKIDFVKFLTYFIPVLILLAIISFTFLPKYTKIKELAEQQDALSERIENTQKDVDTLKKDLKSFKEDPFYLEKAARNQLGAVKENEVVIHIEGEAD